MSKTAGSKTAGGRAALRRGGGVALHLRISADLAAHIRSGAWPPGRKMPFEHELMDSYGCARATASKAMEALAAAGLVERRRRAGSFVAAPRMQSVVLEIPELRAEITARGGAYGYSLLGARRRELDAGDADEALLGAAGPVLEIHCLHASNGRPFALEARLINLAAAPEALEADFAAVSPGAWLLDHVAWSEAEHRISAGTLGEATAGALDAGAGDACLILRRWTWRAGEGVTFVRQTFAAESLELVARFEPRAFRQA